MNTLEARRQQALLAALDPASNHDDIATSAAGIGASGPRAGLGLAAYRANATATAERALIDVFPTLRAMVGAGDFAHLARGFWSAHPPRRGDLGEWGDAFPAWLEALPALAEWPYLGDCARLELALRHNERAADAVFDAGSLGLLGSADPARLVLRLRPGSAVLRSAWPIATIHMAHRAAGGETGFAAVRAALAAGGGETVLVVREGWRATLHRLDPASAGWTDSLFAGSSLAESLARAGDGFDFSAWLVDAVRGSWLQRVEHRPEPGDAPADSTGEPRR